MVMSEEKRRVLLLTVGTGNVENVEKTLFEPLSKSIQKGEYAQVILLPSQNTKQCAEKLLSRFPNLLISVKPLPEKGQEDNVYACYAHFESVVNELLSDGKVKEADIIVDFTRGTKAMSAALVLAAVRHDIPNLRYITSQERDARGMVTPGTEEVSEFSIETIINEKTLERACLFFRNGNFAAASEILPKPEGHFAVLKTKSVLEKASYLRKLSDFYLAWDSLNYKEATKIEIPSCPLPEFKLFAPTEKMKEWVRELASPFPEEYPAKANRLRLLAADLLANGERRIRDGQYEDAYLRAYRVLELVGQLRLFEKELDSSNLPPNNKYVQSLRKKLQKGKNTTNFGKNKEGNLTAGRKLVAQLLKEMSDPLGQRLLNLGKKYANFRNLSILTHGFEPIGRNNENFLKDFYTKLEELLIDDNENAEQYLAIARRLDFKK